MIVCGPFFKVVILVVDVFETAIVEEQNFSDRADAEKLAQQWCNDDNVALVINCK